MVEVNRGLDWRSLAVVCRTDALINDQFVIFGFRSEKKIIKENLIFSGSSCSPWRQGVADDSQLFIFKLMGQGHAVP